MTSRPFPISVRPDYGATRRRGVDTLVRAATAFLLRHVTDPPMYTADVLRAHFPDDEAVAWMTRAVTAPADQSTAGWAKDLVGLGIVDFITLLSPQYASATLLSRGVQTQFNDGGFGIIRLPAFASDPDNVASIEENKPIPLLQFDTSGGIELTAKKLAVLTAFSRETFEHTTPTIEAIVRQVLSESVGRALDKALFDAVAASAARPAGLLNGIVATPAAGAQSTTYGQVINDFQNLASAVGAVAGPIIFICSPAQAVAARLYLGRFGDFEILSSAALGAGVVIAVASNALASAVDPQPRLELARDATLTFDTAVADLVATGALQAGSLTKSLFQSDAIGLRLVMSVSWGLRSPTGLAWTTVSW